MDCWHLKMNEREDRDALLKEINDVGFQVFGEHDSYTVIHSYFNNPSKETLKDVYDELLPLCKLLNKLFFDHPTFES